MGKRKEILKRYEEFCDRGASVVMPEYIGHWEHLMYTTFQDKQNNKHVEYNGVIIEGALDIMEILSNDLHPINEIFKQDDNGINKWKVADQELDQLQTLCGLALIGAFHYRGPEFCSYRDDCRKGYSAPTNIMTKKLDIKE
ncbi:MAG: hypothetical protein GX265_03475 [Mollicutes bacterium]|jgi:hypothetical protein|nr:hypothetical protein [Mollicutes bacterium]